MTNPNDEWDHGTGFTQVSCDLQDRFGAMFSFGYAGGCVNMVAFLEGGLVVNVTDYQDCFLTPIHQRNGLGFTVGVYTTEGFANGDPLSLYGWPTGEPEDLGDYIDFALRGETAGRSI
jgi:hypothetical protein